MDNPMKFGATVLVLAAIVSVVFALAMTKGWLQAIFSFKNFGWLGIGVFYLKVSAVLVVLFLYVVLCLAHLQNFLLPSMQVAWLCWR